MEPTPTDGSRAAPRRRGCLFWASVAVFLIAVSVGGSIGIAFYYVNSVLVEISSDEPALSTSAEEREASQQRGDPLAVASLEDFPSDPDGPDVRQFSLDDANRFFADGAGGQLSDRLFLRADGEDLLLDVSWPLDEISSRDDFAGRHLNATLRGRVSIEAGQLSVKIEEATTVDGNAKVPDMIIGLAERAAMRALGTRHPEWIEGIERLEFSNGRFEIEASASAAGARRAGRPGRRRERTRPGRRRRVSEWAIRPERLNEVTARDESSAASSSTSEFDVRGRRQRSASQSRSFDGTMGRASWSSPVSERPTT